MFYSAFTIVGTGLHQVGPGAGGLGTRGLGGWGVGTRQLILNCILKLVTCTRDAVGGCLRRRIGRV